MRHAHPVLLVENRDSVVGKTYKAESAIPKCKQTCDLPQNSAARYSPSKEKMK